MNNEMRKFVVFDLDGTLLNDKGEVDQINIAAIEKFHNQFPSAILAIATGTGKERALQACQQFKKHIKYLICYNGAVTINIADEVQTNIRTLTKKQCKDFIRIAKKYQAQGVQAYDYYHKKISNLLDIEKYYDEKLLSESDKNFLFKGTLVFPYEKQKIDNVIKEIAKEYPDFEITEVTLPVNHLKYNVNSDHVALEFNMKDTNKCQAVAVCLRVNEVLPKNLIVFGDSTNDEKLFDFTVNNGGKAVAMANSHECILKICNDSTSKNTEGGVGRKLDEYCMKALNIQQENTVNNHDEESCSFQVG